MTPSYKRKTGKAVRHQFSIGDVLLVKVLIEFPFPLSKEDKQSLAQILAGGDRRAARWSREGADLVYRSGDMQVSFECKAFRRTVARNLAAFRWGRRRVVSDPDILGGEPGFRGTRIPLQHVASLFRKGVVETEIAEDFPALSARDLVGSFPIGRHGTVGAPGGSLGMRFVRGIAQPAILTFMLCLLAAASSAGGQSLQDRINLDTGWQLQSSCNVTEAAEVVSRPEFTPSHWIPAKVPTTVMAALVAAKAGASYEDPYFGENLWQIPGMNYAHGEIFSSLPFPQDSPFRCAWWYRLDFRVPENLRGRQLWLNFGGINYRADIWINGTRIANGHDVAGAYRAYEFNISDLLRPGNRNVLAVRVSPPQPENLGINWVDWNPAPADKNMGLWREVYVASSGPISIRNPQVQTRVGTGAAVTADVRIAAELHNNSAQPIEGILEGRFDDVRFQQRVTLFPNQIQVVRFAPESYPRLHLRNPQLWWPRQMGEPNLKILRLAFKIAGRESDRQSVRFGIREIQSELNHEGQRIFRVNGKPILIRGAGWSPDMLLRDEPERMRQQFAYVRHMGLNTIRLEGKMESDLFYNLADEMGILVMAGWCCCDVWEQWDQWIPENETVALESLRSQVLRLRNHPSILAWLNGSDNPPSEKVEREYLKMLSALEWPNPVVSSATQQATAVSGPSGVKMFGPYDWIPPSYWTLDKNKLGGAWGFNSETSPGAAIPPLESLRRFIAEKDLWPVNEVWFDHAGIRQFRNLNLLISAMQQRYGEARDLEDFVNKSQAIAYEGERAMFEAFSRNKYTSTGVIQWMLNNAWPGLIWHLYDYYLNPGAGYFAARKANEPVHVLYGYDDHSVYAVNSTYRPVKGISVTATVLNFDLKPQYEKTVTIDLNADESRRLFELPNSADLSTTYFVRLRADNGQEHSDNFYWLSAKPDALDWNQPDGGHTWMTEHADLTALNTLPKVDLQVTGKSIRRQGDEAVIVLAVRNPSASLAFMTHLRLVRSTNASESKNGPACNATTLDAACGEDVLPILWEDNYFSLLPGEEREISVRYSSKNPDPSPVVAIDGWNMNHRRVAITKTTK